MHERDQRFDITRAERFVRRPNLLHESMVAPLQILFSNYRSAITPD
jgi:hypothetical protein